MVVPLKETTMNSIGQIHPVPRRIDEPVQQPYTEAFDRYLIERGYARNTVRAYLGYPLTSDMR